VTPARSIGAAQTIPARGDVDTNVDRHLRLVRLAADRQARVLVFPELSLTGYEPDLAEDLAFTPRDPRLEPLVEAAASRSVTLVVGAPVRIDSRLHIGAFVVAPDGTVEVCTKRHLGAFSTGAAADGIVPPAEATVFRPGERNPLIDIEGNLAAVAVCADTGHPSHPREAAERGARIYLASMFVIPSEFERESANLERHAARHSMAVAMANYGGPSGGLASAGGSAVWSERGELLARLEGSGAGVVVALETDAGWRASTAVLGGA